MKRLLLIPAVLLLFSSVYAQTGKEFWFAVPYVDATHDNNNTDTEVDGITKKQTGPNYFRISTGEAGAAVAFYYYPGGVETLLHTASITANSTGSVKLTDDGTEDISLNSFTNRQESTVLERGIKIVSNNPITIYYEIGSHNNSDIFSIKGDDALGVLFYPTFQTSFANELQGGYAKDSWSSADIVATEDNTTVNIELPSVKNQYFTRKTITEYSIWTSVCGNTLYYTKTKIDLYLNGVFDSNISDNDVYADLSACGSLGGSWVSSTTATDSDRKVTFGSYATTPIVLNKGETYSVSSKTDNEKTAVKNLDGIIINSDKPIAVTIKDDSAKDDWAADVIGDQIIPARLAGTHYILPDFQTTGGASMNQGGYVRALHDGTEINIDGQVNPVATLNTGDIYSYTSFLNNDSYVHIYGSDAAKPFLCFQITGTPSGTATQTELAGAVMPPVDRCTGSTQACFQLPASASESKIAILSRSNDLSKFYYKKEGDVAWTSFSAIPGVTFSTISIPSYTDWYLTYLDNYLTVVKDVNYIIKNTESTFHLGVLSRVETGGSLGSFYGFFSGYTEPQIQLGFDFKDHDSNPATDKRVFLYAFGGVEGTYEWDMMLPSSTGTDCSDYYFDAALNLPTCFTANPTILSDNILDITDFFRYRAAGQSTCYATPKISSLVQFEIIERVASFVPLPVEFIDVKAQHTGGNTITISWATASESNNHYFTVERTDGKGPFEPVTTVAGNGNSSTRNDYLAMDQVPRDGVYYYRVRQVDFDGNFSYSKTAAVLVGNAKDPINVYPTIVSGGQSISIVPDAPEGTDIMIKLYSSDGQYIYAGVHAYISGALEIRAPFQRGFYKICLEYSNHIYSQSIMVNP